MPTSECWKKRTDSDNSDPARPDKGTNKAHTTPSDFMLSSTAILTSNKH